MIVEVGKEWQIHVEDFKPGLGITCGPELFMEFNENLTKPAETEENKLIREFYEHRVDRGGEGHIFLDNHYMAFGEKEEDRVKNCESKFERIAGVEKIETRQYGARLFQAVSSTCTRYTAFQELLQQKGLSQFNVVLGVASSAKQQNKSCVAIFMCKGPNDPLMKKQSALDLSTSLYREYKKWNYYFVGNLPLMLQQLFVQYGENFSRFLTPTHQEIIPSPTNYNIVITNPSGSFRYFNDLPTTHAELKTFVEITQRNPAKACDPTDYSGRLLP